MQLASFSVLEKSHIINPLLTKLVRSRWQDIGRILAFFCLFLFMDLDFVSVHKHARKKELGQYPAILTSRLVNNLSTFFGLRNLTVRPMHIDFSTDRRFPWICLTQSNSAVLFPISRTSFRFSWRFEKSNSTVYVIYLIYIIYIKKKAILAIRSISRMRKYLSHDNLKCIVNAFVISRLDYCNSILYGLPKLEHDKLQRI